MKTWYQSKLVWLGVIQFLIGCLGLVGEFLNKGDSSPFAVTVLLTGVLTIVMRIWFTDTSIQ
jgi:hypothetical protein